jgi:hypothetical protein
MTNFEVSARARHEHADKCGAQYDGLRRIIATGGADAHAAQGDTPLAPLQVTRRKDQLASATPKAARRGVNNLTHASGAGGHYDFAIQFYWRQQADRKHVVIAGRS